MLYFARWKIALIALTVLAAVIVAVPNLLPASTAASLPSWLPHKQLVLGLDLRGGAHLLLQVERDSLIEERAETLVSDVRQTLRAERIGYRNLRAKGQTVSLTLRDTADAEKAMTALRPLANPIPSGLFNQSTVSEVDLALDGDRITATLNLEGLEERVRSAVEQSKSVLERRINELGTTEPTIQREGTDRILVQVPGLEDTRRLKDIIGQTAKMTFHMECSDGSLGEALQSRPPAGCEIAEPADEADGPILIESRARISGDDLVDAQPGFDQRSNQPIVSFRFNTRGAAVFGNLTQDNVGRRFAVVLDDKVITAPVIRSPILGGSGQIEGSFTVESAQNLAVLLRAGALPADLTIIEERTVGPSLGQDSIDAGRIAALIGMAAVIVFMLLVYGLFGIFANLALAANIAMVFGILTALQATLTLPGIAGIVLTIGMAVDANVLIFERIREESKLGRTAINAIEAGFSRALGTIMDAQITTLIAAIALFALGSGPIRGFGVTLVIGIMTTIFTAFLLTRLIVATWVRSSRPKSIPI